MVTNVEQTIQQFLASEEGARTLQPGFAYDLFIEYKAPKSSGGRGGRRRRFRPRRRFQLLGTVWCFPRCWYYCIAAPSHLFYSDQLA